MLNNYGYLIVILFWNHRSCYTMIMIIFVYQNLSVSGTSVINLRLDFRDDVLLQLYIAIWKAAMMSYRYLHCLKSKLCSHLCYYYHNVLAVMLPGLHQAFLSREFRTIFYGVFTPLSTFMDISFSSFFSITQF